MKELFFGYGGPYEKFAALPAASVPVSDLQRAVQPYICKDWAIPFNIRPLLLRRTPKKPIFGFGRKKKKPPSGHPPKPIFSF